MLAITHAQTIITQVITPTCCHILLRPLLAESSHLNTFTLSNSNTHNSDKVNIRFQLTHVFKTLFYYFISFYILFYIIIFFFINDVAL